MAKSSGIDKVVLRRDGSFTAERADHVGKGGVDLFAVAPVDVTKDKVSFGEGDLLYGGEYFKDVRNGELTFKDGVVQTVKFTFSKNDIFVLRNPLTTGKTVSYLDVLDSDGDGLPDSFESTNGLNISNTDTDGDGLSDYDEIMKYPTDATLYNTFPQLKLKSDKEFVEW